MRQRRASQLAAVAVGAVLALAAPTPVHAESRAAQVDPSGVLVSGGAPQVVTRRDTAAVSVTEARDLATSARALPEARRSTIVVTYHGFPAGAQAAVAKAADTWSRLVSPPVPIRVDATWTALPTGVLGTSRPEHFARDFAGAPVPATFYPSALANALAGTDLSPDPDVEVQVSSAVPDWYLGTDGRVPADRIDLATVALHELGHSLGLLSCTGVSNGTGTWGMGTSYPCIDDRFIEGTTGVPITDLPNGSTTLAAVLQSGAVRWSGGQAVQANGGARPVIYAPKAFKAGASISHLDEATYGLGNPNALMSPYLDDGESLADPGEVSMGMLRDLGWITAPAVQVPGIPAVTKVVAGTARVVLAWTPSADTGGRPLTGYRISRYLAGSTQPQATTDVSAASTSATLTGLVNGTAYRFSVAARTAAGLGATSARSASVTPSDLTPFVRADVLVSGQFQDFLGRAPTAAEQLLWLGGLQQATTTPQATVTGIAQVPASADPSGRITRLYRAYFGRLPDYSGYVYWTGKLRRGTSLQKASDAFASSSEFTARYGSLSTTAFVKLVYLNVLGRPADPAGLAHWVAKLSSRSMSRGAVMVSFSESSENLRRSAAAVTSVLVRSGMLRRLPTTVELAADVKLLDGSAEPVDLVAQVLRSAEYGRRIG